MSWPITLGISIFFHSLLIFLLNLTPWHIFVVTPPSPYTVTLMPVSIPSPETLPPPPPPPPAQKPEVVKPVVKPVEKIKPVEKPKKDDIVEKVKPKERDQASLDRLQEALEEIRKKQAIDEIQKRIAKQEVPREPIPPAPPVVTPSPAPAPTNISPPSLSPALRESKLNEYYGLIWAKIKQSWTLPENLLKERVDLETIIVIIIDREGRVKRSWIEKKSGHALYDQMAMRAIIKAEPLPPIPKELNQDSLEIGIRFLPD